MTAPLRNLVIDLAPDRGLTDDLASAETGWIGFANLPEHSARMAELQLVMAPLVSGGADALDVLEALGALGFHGNLRIVAPPLPNRQIVLRELRAAALGRRIRLELVEAG